MFIGGLRIKESVGQKYPNILELLKSQDDLLTLFSTRNQHQETKVLY